MECSKYRSSEQPGEAGLSREEHAGSITFRPLHYRETRGLIHRAVDGWLRLSKPRQVRLRVFILMSEVKFLYLLLGTFKTRGRPITTDAVNDCLDLNSKTSSLWMFWFHFHEQTAGMDKPAERRHREAEKTSCQEETSVLQQLSSTNHKLWAKATQNQGSKWSRKWSLSKTQPTSTVSLFPETRCVKLWRNLDFTHLQNKILNRDHFFPV